MSHSTAARPQAPDAAMLPRRALLFHRLARPSATAPGRSAGLAKAPLARAWPTVRRGRPTSAGWRCANVMRFAAATLTKALTQCHEIPPHAPQSRPTTVSLLGFNHRQQARGVGSSGVHHAIMKHIFKWRHMHKPIRDFVCALVVFSALFVVMSPARHDAAPIIPVLSMFSGATATASDYRPAAGAAPTSAHDSVRNRPLPSANMPLISTVLALVFSSIMAFNLALLRHLRRVNASSRRGAWKEG